VSVPAAGTAGRRLGGLLPLSFAADVPAPVWQLFALLVGLVVGSFANVCIYRVPAGLSVVAPPSRCPVCGSRIRAQDNVPILSYLALGGRCRACRTAISLRYPAVEAANGLAYFAVATSLGPTPRALTAMAFATSLIVLGLIDLDHQILPNAITLPGIAAGLAASLLPGAGPRLLEAAAAAGAGYLALAAVAAVARWHYGHEALGQGDWKMVAMMGAFLGVRGTLVAVFLGTLTGAVVGLGAIALGRGTRRSKLPLGSFLAIGGLAALVAGDRLTAAYRGLWGG
jgi:leader peptidase (prepilin peptidase)/N-methyltransferase